jgi:hypothetical protein
MRQLKHYVVEDLSLKGPLPNFLQFDHEIWKKDSSSYYYQTSDNLDLKVYDDRLRQLDITVQLNTEKKQLSSTIRLSGITKVMSDIRQYDYYESYMLINDRLLSSSIVPRIHNLFWATYDAFTLAVEVDKDQSHLELDEYEITTEVKLHDLSLTYHLQVMISIDIALLAGLVQSMITPKSNRQKIDLVFVNGKRYQFELGWKTQERAYLKLPKDDHYLNALVFDKITWYTGWSLIPHSTVYKNLERKNFLARWVDRRIQLVEVNYV